MGDVANAMLSGDLCAQCGAFMNENCIDQGFPIYCDDCHRENEFSDDVPKESDFLSNTLSIIQKKEHIIYGLIKIKNKYGFPKYTMDEMTEILETIAPFL